MLEFSFTSSPPWELDRREDDIRGWALRDREGHTLGMVDELIVDTRTENVVEVVLGDGKKFSAHDVFVGDHVPDPLWSRKTHARGPQTNPAQRSQETRADPWFALTRKDIASRNADVPSILRAAPVAGGP